MNKLIIAIIIFLLPVACLSAPDITGVSGTLTTGETVTVSGTGFTESLPTIEFVGPEIEATTTGQIPSVTNWLFDSAGTNIDPIAATDQKHSGSKSLYQNLGTMSGGMFRYTHPSNIGYDQTLMVSWWVRRNRTGASDYQWKLFRFGYSANSFIDDYTPQIKWFEHDARYDQFFVNPGPGTNAINGGPPYPEDYLQTAYPSVDDRWYRADIIVHTSSAQNVADGWYTHRLYDPTGGVVSEHSKTNLVTFNTGTNDFYKYFFWQNWMETSLLTSHKLWFDDMHIQVGGQQRVELCNGTSWDSRTSCDVQESTAMSTTGATVTFNAGGFAAGSTAHLYVVDSSGVANSLGYPVEIGASGAGDDTTPPVLSLLAPSGTLASGTTSTTISLVTDEAATCRYSTTPGTAYADMTLSFDSSYAMSHSATVSGLTNGGSYTYQVRCINGIGLANTTDSPISFSVASSAGTAGVLSFEYSTYSAERSDVRIPINIIRTGGSTGSVTAQWSSNGQTATHDVDYYGNDNVTVTFADGVTSIPINTYGSGDNGILMIANGADDDRYFQMILTNPTGGATLGTTLATVTIEGDYVAPVPGMRVGVGRTPISVGQTPITPMQ